MAWYHTITVAAKIESVVMGRKEFTFSFFHSTFSWFTFVEMRFMVQTEFEDWPYFTAINSQC